MMSITYMCLALTYSVSEWVYPYPVKTTVDDVYDVIPPTSALKNPKILMKYIN